MLGTNIIVPSLLMTKMPVEAVALREHCEGENTTSEYQQTPPPSPHFGTRHVCVVSKGIYDELFFLLQYHVPLFGIQILCWCQRE